MIALNFDEKKMIQKRLKNVFRMFYTYITFS